MKYPQAFSPQLLKSCTVVIQKATKLPVTLIKIAKIPGRKKEKLRRNNEGSCSARSAEFIKGAAGSSSGSASSSSRNGTLNSTRSDSRVESDKYNKSNDLARASFSLSLCPWLLCDVYFARCRSHRAARDKAIAQSVTNERGGKFYQHISKMYRRGPNGSLVLRFLINHEGC